MVQGLSPGGSGGGVPIGPKEKSTDVGNGP